MLVVQNPFPVKHEDEFEQVLASLVMEAKRRQKPTLLTYGRILILVRPSGGVKMRVMPMAKPPFNGRIFQV